MQEGAHICEKTEKNKKKLTLPSVFTLSLGNPSAKVKTLGKGTGLAECISLGTRQSWGLAECL